jgi:hypothetical protein
MNVLGARAAASFNSEPDIKAWDNGVALNPARILPKYDRPAALDDALGRLRTHAAAGVAKLEQLGGVAAACGAGAVTASPTGQQVGGR